MNNNDVRTPKGAKLGERIHKGGNIFLRYKSGHTVDDLRPELLVELVTGRKVERIDYVE